MTFSKAHHVAYGQALSFDFFNLYHANFWIIEPATRYHRGIGCSFVELVSTSTASQRPTWFVSHAWSEPIWKFALCLKRHIQLHQLPPTTAYWVCAYANNQHQLNGEICDNPRKTSFYRALKACVGVLLILDQDATAFTRILGFQVQFMWRVLLGVRPNMFCGTFQKDPFGHFFVNQKSPLDSRELFDGASRRMPYPRIWCCFEESIAMEELGDVPGEKMW